jgi:hypothetical protein
LSGEQGFGDARDVRSTSRRADSGNHVPAGTRRSVIALDAKTFKGMSTAATR